jgi:acetyltransferase
VYPVNPAREAVQGIHAWPNVKSLPHPPDLAVLAIPAGRVPDVVRECGESGVRGLVIISAGFRESGEEGKALEDRVLEEARRFDGMRIIGPNCLGFIVPGLKLNASFAAAMPAAGRVAFLSQSGALCTSVLDWAAGEGVGFSLFVSTGNMLDVGMSDLLDYLAADPATDSVILYLESITKARDFMSAARAFARVKPIVAYKAGRFAESAKAAASHTGALAGLDDVYEAALKRAGIVRISQMDDMFDCAELLARRRMVRGRRLAILTNAGGPGVMATDALMERRGTLAPLAPATIEQLNAVLPPFWSHGNPVDVLGDAPAERFSRALSIVVADPSVDAALVMLAPQAMTDPTTTARAVAAVADGTDRPVLAAWIGGPGMQPAQDLLNRAGIPTYSTPEKAVRAFSYLVAHAANRETLYETPRDIPIEFRPDKDRARTLFQRNVEAGHTFLSEDESKALLEEWSIPVVRSGRAQS